MIGIAAPIVQTFVVNGIIVAIFLILSILLIVRNQNRIAVSLALYFFTVCIGLIINMIYRYIDQYLLNLILNKVTIAFTALAAIHLLNFNFLLGYSTKKWTRKRQLILTLIYALFLVVLFFIPNGVEWQYENGQGIAGFNARTNPDDVGVPVYSPFFGIYGLIISQIPFIILFIFAFRFKSKMGHSIYGTKYIRSLIGILCFDLQLISAFFAHTLNIGIARTIALILSILIIPGSFLLYFGLKREPET